MKKVISILLTLTLTILLLTSCAGEISISGSKYYTDFDGVYITIDAVEGEGNKQKLVTTWHNETEYPVTFGLWYVIEYKDGDEWENVQIVDYAIPEIACMLEPNSEVPMSYATEYFRFMREGTYRLRSECYVQTRAESNTTAILYTEFAVAK